ncbi:adenosylmethionine--8-amino-7-oxononanoate transaminase [Phycicoccus sp. MAQZ13P-2]|uniref:adenosylmethionine--8-amino-7-oxononanoate transaminase n=1 Tax=Phycicoccus mangrovi TaxID=2840470 RepID=UPI001C00325B|nr:adenosylmethionine--8-amino-7-oxononanoate transaminase [Phycicoccus mangrovi]MBT9255460.1 adenosylmethionine--8-amino-7-oxononanoate transaminase [Phycicoccus mangrovi]MBT9273510.1 adenosylmethionine--8-amino-7-oxononanoate transaminase [Phycicoccus mangrovi]
MDAAALAALRAFDRAHVWHPYSSALTPTDPYVVESAEGVRLRLRDAAGDVHEVVDAMSSWWCAVHGYRVPELDAAVTEQLGRMAHVMFGGLTHEPAVELSRRLLALAPAGLEHVFLADSGSVSVEVAMKAALQYHLAAGRRRTRFLTVRGGYHGDTFSPMSVTDPDGGMHTLFRGVLPEHVFAPRPPAGLDLAADDPALVAWEAATRELFAQNAADIAAVILEPVLQGAGGMHVYPPRVLEVLHGLAREHGALVIHDEIATGFHRTGPRWAGDRVPTAPDILCVGKALTGGYLTLAAMLCTREVAEGVSRGAGGGLMHGPTFMANPLACAVAVANLDLLARRDTAAEVARLESGLRDGLASATALSTVVDVRVLGAVGVVQLAEPVRVAEVTAAAIARGVWVRPFRDLVYTMPPYVTSDEDLRTLTAGLVGAVADVHG